jgi:HD-like signal output (HDOD) protein
VIEAGGRHPRDVSSNPFREDDAPPRPKQRSSHDPRAFEFVRQLAADLSSGEFDLPPFPDTALKVQRCIRDPDSNIQRLSAIVANEPALAARVIRVANSVMMRRGPFEVTDINTAVSRVGMNMVQNIAVSFAAHEAFRLPPGSVGMQELNALRQQSIRAATLCYVIARQVRAIRNADEAMLAGLLSAVGKLYILSRASDHPDLFEDRSTVETLVATWHTGVARAIVESWDFPEAIAIAVGECEHGERDRIGSADLSDLLHVANLLAHSSASFSDTAATLSGIDALARMRMSAEELATLLDGEAEEIDTMIAAMNC